MYVSGCIIKKAMKLRNSVTAIIKPSVDPARWPNRRVEIKPLGGKRVCSLFGKSIAERVSRAESGTIQTNYSIFREMGSCSSRDRAPKDVDGKPVSAENELQNKDRRNSDDSQNSMKAFLVSRQFPMGSATPLL